MAEYLSKKDVDKSCIDDLFKGVVLQEARVFNELPLNYKSCYKSLSRILWSLTNCDPISPREATDLFFAVTKMFQSQNVLLRKMTYMVLEGLAKICESVMMITAIIAKDMTNENALFRANAIRMVKFIADMELMSNVERFLKQSIVDGNVHVSSCALVCGIHLTKVVPNVVRRWISEVNEVISSRTNMSQYHAVALFYEIRKNDPMTIKKLVHNSHKNHFKCHFTHLLLIRYCYRLLVVSSDYDATILKYLESCLHFNSEMVVFEAARTICLIPNIDSRYIHIAINTLLPFLMSVKTPYRFAAVRVLYNIVQKYPEQIDNNIIFELRNLISDINRYVSTLSILILLKVEKESSIVQLLTQISTYISCISDDLKMCILDGIHFLTLKYPSYHAHTTSALGSMLKIRAGIDYKSYLIDIFSHLMQEIPESTQAILKILCEYIEDCDSTYTSKKILRAFGQWGTLDRELSRYIFNRIILEKSIIRFSAVSALSNLASISENIVPLLYLCKKDHNDLIRDTVSFRIALIENKVQLDPIADIPFKSLESHLENYLEGSIPNFDPKSVVLNPQMDQQKQPIIDKISKMDDDSYGQLSSPELAPLNDIKVPLSFEEIWKMFPELGAMFKTSAPYALTEEDTEYCVVCFIHTFHQTKSLLLQFNIVNSLPDQAISNIEVDLKQVHGKNVWNIIKLSSGINEQTLFPNVANVENCVARVFYVLQADSFIPTTFNCTLKFRVFNLIDSEKIDETSSFPDQYQLDDLALTATNLFKPSVLNSWNDAWESSVPDEENWLQKVVLISRSDCKSLQSAVDRLIATLSLHPCSASDQVPSNKNKHVLLLSGIHCNGAKILIQIRMKVINPSSTEIAMEFTIRSNSSKTILEAINLMHT